MKVKEVVEGWKKGELSGDAAMCVIHDIFYPATIDEEDIKWAKNCTSSASSTIARKEV